MDENNDLMRRRRWRRRRMGGESGCLNAVLDSEERS